MQELLDRALNAASATGATHAEARVVTAASENYEVKDGAPAAAAHSAGEGLCVRAIANGAWRLRSCCRSSSAYRGAQDLSRLSAPPSL